MWAHRPPVLMDSYLNTTCTFSILKKIGSPIQKLNIVLKFYCLKIMLSNWETISWTISERPHESTIQSFFYSVVQFFQFALDKLPGVRSRLPGKLSCPLGRLPSPIPGVLGCLSDDLYPRTDMLPGGVQASPGALLKPVPPALAQRLLGQDQHHQQKNYGTGLHLDTTIKPDWIRLAPSTEELR